MRPVVPVSYRLLPNDAQRLSQTHSQNLGLLPSPPKTTPPAHRPRRRADTRRPSDTKRAAADGVAAVAGSPGMSALAERGALWRRAMTGDALAVFRFGSSTSIAADAAQSWLRRK